MIKFKADLRLLMFIRKLKFRSNRCLRYTAIILCVFIYQGFSNLMADEQLSIKRSVRALGMGNAFIAVANDESALFYNPAGLQSVQQHIFEPLTINGSTNQDLIDIGTDLFNNGASTNILTQLTGMQLFGELGGNVLSITGPGWGYSLFGEAEFSMAVHNPVIPYFDINTYLQYGFIFGLGFDTLDETLDWGFNLKYVGRMGINQVFHLVDFLDDQFMTNLTDFNRYTPKAGLTPDVGFIYTIDSLYNLDPKIAFVARNIGGLDFGPNGSIPMSFDTGVSTETEISLFDIILAADLIDITSATTAEASMARNVKLGVEIGIFKRSNGHHAISFRLGKNGAYQTMGFTLNPWYIPFKLEVAQWSEEVGSVAGAKEDKRYSMELSIFNF